MNNVLEQYKKLINGNIFEVSLPSGVVFKVKKINSRELLKTGKIPLLNLSSIDNTSTEKYQLTINNMSVDERKSVIDYNDRIICACCIDPIVSMTREEGKLHIDDIIDEDYYALLNTIVGANRGDDLKPFRK